MKALIAAGGRATRLRPITHTINKHLIPLANKPMIEYAIEKIQECGITEVAINTNPGEQELQKVLGDGSRWEMNITYIEQRGGAKGIAHAIANAAEWLGDEPFVYYLGDNIILGSIKILVDRFERDDLDCLLALSKVSDPQRFGVPEIRNGQITRVVEKPKNPPSEFAVTGIYIYKPIILKAVQDIRPSERGEYEISDAHTWLINHAYKVGYEEITGWWKDTGKPDDLLRGNEHLLDLMKDTCTSYEGIVTVGNSKKLEGYTLHNQSKDTKYVDVELDDRWCLAVIAEEHESVVDHVSILDSFAAYPRRIPGTYQHGAATAILNAPVCQNTPHSLRITSDDIEDAVILYDSIRSGTVLPTVSWDEQQVTEARKVTCTRKHLRERSRPRFRLGRPRAA